MNLLERLTNANAPQPHTITLPDGSEETIHFRLITAAERRALMNGTRVATKGGQSEIEIDLGANEATKHQMVAYSACNADGSPLFTSVKEVTKVPAVIVNQLFRHASKINQDPTETELGKD